MPVPVKTKHLRATTAKERIYNEVSEWIKNGTLQPGEKVNEAEIAAYFEVSRTPVHEALQLLADQRLIIIEPSKGSFVAPLTVENGHEVYEALATISGHVAGAACGKRTDPQLAELEKRAEAFEKAYRAGRLEELPALDKAFHTYICEIAGNSYLTEYAQQLHMHAYRFEYLLTKYMSDRTTSIKEHREIIEAIRNRDEEKAARAGYDNWIGSFENQIRHYIEAYSREKGGRE